MAQSKAKRLLVCVGTIDENVDQTPGELRPDRAGYCPMSPSLYMYLMADL